MKRYLLALAASLAAISLAQADSYTDAGGTISQGVVDVSRTAHAAIQCVLTVTSTATSLASLWATAACPTALPTTPPGPQLAYVMPTTGAVYYRTDGVTVTAANGWEIFQDQAWPIEGRLSIGALQMIAASNVTVSVEVRW